MILTDTINPLCYVRLLQSDCYPMLTLGTLNSVQSINLRALNTRDRPRLQIRP